MFSYCLLHPEISLPSKGRARPVQPRADKRIYMPEPRRTGRFGRR